MWATEEVLIETFESGVSISSFLMDPTSAAAVDDAVGALGAITGITDSGVGSGAAPRRRRSCNQRELTEPSGDLVTCHVALLGWVALRHTQYVWGGRHYPAVCVCVCVCERDDETERQKLKTYRRD